MLSNRVSTLFLDLIPIRPLPPVAKEDSWHAHVASARQWSQRRIAAHVESPDVHTQDELKMIANGEALLSDAAGGAGATKGLGHLWTVEAAHVR